MAGQPIKDQGIEENSDVPAIQKRDDGATVKENKRGLISRIWNGLLRIRGDDFETRLQHITKEEVAILARMKTRSLNWRRMARRLIIFSVFLEVIAVGYAIMTTKSLELDWKLRAFRVLPMFLLPLLSSIIYSALVSFTRMCDRKDQKTLERLRAERQAKIDELKEKTNYYITQQLIQRYDPDPAAKAAAATVLASKLGADSGLKFYVGDDDESNKPKHKQKPGRRNETIMESSTSSGLRNRKQSSQQQQHQHTRSSSSSTEILHSSDDEMSTKPPNQVVVEHYQRRPGSTSHDDGAGGWIARIAALLVGEDPTDSFALICGNCHMHNGLARKEDFPFITYYCPHCNALNRSSTKQQQEEEHRTTATTTTTTSCSNSPTATNLSSPTVLVDETMNNAGDDNDDRGGFLTGEIPPAAADPDPVT